MLDKLAVGLGILLGFSGLALASTMDTEAATLYRAYNPNTGEHLYTANGNEIPFVVSKGWRNEGTAWEAPSQGVPVYRMFNPNRGGDHHFTMNTNEVNMLKSKGWRYEGVSWQSGGSTPVYRLYNPNARSGAHHFTRHAYERDNLKSKGWRYEGVAWYATEGGTPAPVDEKVLGVPFIGQGNTMLCEGASLLQAMHYKGQTNQNLMSFVNSMPIASDNNPYNGYSGEWRHNVDGTYQGMMAAPVVTWAGKNGGNAVNITGAGSQGIKNEIRNGNPVVAWGTYQYATPQFKQMPWGRAVWNGHVVTVDGFKDGAYRVVDPVFGAQWINAGTFEAAFNVTGMAVAVR